MGVITVAKDFFLDIQPSTSLSQTIQDILCFYSKIDSGFAWKSDHKSWWKE